MPKVSTLPTLLDGLNQLSITDLKKWGYIKKGAKVSGVVRWGEHSSIGITVDYLREQPYLELNYTSGGENVNYRVNIVSVPSNLGKGKVWYFMCSIIGKRCRKLYCSNKYFSHREAHTHAMYSSQTQSRQSRTLCSAMDALHKIDDFAKDGKQWRRYYNGKPTRRYKQYLKLQSKASISISAARMLIEDIFD